MFLFILDGGVTSLIEGVDGLLMSSDISNEYTWARWESDKNKTLSTPDRLLVSCKEV